MAYIHFKERFAAYKGLPSAASLDDPEVIRAHPDYAYALSSRKRGIEYVERIKRISSTPIESTSLLDIGCATGGIVIEAALAGASAAGVDVVRSYLDLAQHNAMGEVELPFYFGDMTVRSTVESMGGPRFNTFVINHALEHIYDTVSLLENIDRIATKDAIIFFDVPNGHSITSFMSEGHTGIFGVSLADPDCWWMFGRDRTRARIYYRKLLYFQALFASFGFRMLVAHDAPRPREAMEDALRQAVVTSSLKAEKSPHDKDGVAEVVLRFRTEVEHDLLHATDHELDLKYFHYFWRGIATRSDRRVRWPYRKNLPLSAWG